MSFREAPRPSVPPPPQQLADGLVPEDLAPEILTFDEALIDLARRSPRQSRIVEMRVIVGLTLEEIAVVEKISLSTVSREWKAARLFLLSQLRDR